MPAPVKISELPAISSVQPNDILPVVDAALTQTSKCTASQIAAIGGGPPGDGTVTEGKIAAGAVTASKVGFTGPDKLISRTLAGAGAGVEIPCTPYARGLLAAADANGARAYLDALQGLTNPTFSGTLTVNGNSVVTGTMTVTGDVLQPLVGVVGGTAYPVYGARAWVNFNGVTATIRASGGVTSVTRIKMGQYRINFSPSNMMPDTNYAIMVTARDIAIGGLDGIGQPNDADYNAVPAGMLNHDSVKQTTHFDVLSGSAFLGTDGLRDTTEFNVAVWR